MYHRLYVCMPVWLSGRISNFLFHFSSVLGNNARQPGLALLLDQLANLLIVVNVVAVHLLTSRKPLILLIAQFHLINMGQCTLIVEMP